MPYDYDAERIYKELPRRMVWDQVKGVAKSALLLTGRDCSDIKVGLAMGKMDINTTLDIFERDTEVCKKIKQNCLDMGLRNFAIWNSTIQNQDEMNLVCCYEEGMESDDPPGLFENYDVMFLDFCGEITQAIYDFLSYEKLNKNGVIAFTFSTLYRHNNFYQDNQSIRKSFHTPKGALQLCNADNSKARWSCDKALESLGLKSESLVHYFHYKDDGCMPMVFFTIDPSKKKKVYTYTKIKQEQTIKKGDTDLKNPVMVRAGKKAAQTRKVNAMQKEYDLASTAGVKAGIKRRMNKLIKQTV